MNKPTYKEIITNAVYEQIPSQLRIATVEESLRRWWQTGVRSNGLRLTEIGDWSFRVAEIEFYQYDFKPKAAENYHGYILDLNKKLKCPYYLGVVKEQGKKNKPYIRLYDSKIAMMLSLYGDLDEYLNSVKTR